MLLLLPYAIRASSESPRFPDDYSPSDHGPRVHRSELVLAYSMDPDALVVCCRPASPDIVRNKAGW
jgi:hypothetical protein